MGNLKPGATYIYEREGGRIYAREFGKSDRQIVGYDIEQHQTAERRYYQNEINSVLLMCEKYPDMKDLLDKLFILYNLRKPNE